MLLVIMMSETPRKFNLAPRAPLDPTALNSPNNVVGPRSWMHSSLHATGNDGGCPFHFEIVMHEGEIEPNRASRILLLITWPKTFLAVLWAHH